MITGTSLFCLPAISSAGAPCGARFPSRASRPRRQSVFGDQPLQNLLADSGGGGHVASELHHLFPKAWLHGHGTTERKKSNQVANLADVGWYDDSSMGSQSPVKYVPRLARNSRSATTSGAGCARSTRCHLPGNRWAMKNFLPRAARAWPRSFVSRFGKRRRSQRAAPPASLVLARSRSR